MKVLDELDIWGLWPRSSPPSQQIPVISRKGICSPIMQLARKYKGEWPLISWSCSDSAKRPKSLQSICKEQNDLIFKKIQEALLNREQKINGSPYFSHKSKRFQFPRKGHFSISLLGHKCNRSDFYEELLVGGQSTKEMLWLTSLWGTGGSRDCPKSDSGQCHPIFTLAQARYKGSWTKKDNGASGKGSAA